MAAPFVWPDLATAVRASLSSGPIHAAVKQVGVDAVRAALAAALEAFMTDEGAVRLDNVYRVVIARA